MVVQVGLLGGFHVRVDDLRVPDEAWSRRHAALVVKLLALSEGHRLHREQLLEALWPGLTVDDAAPRLHKAAHYARRALGDDPEAVVLRHDMVSLLPGRDVVVDVEVFLDLGRRALSDASPAEAERALELCSGELLPEDPYEPWASAMRDVVRTLRLDLLRLAERWGDVVHEEPTDEEAHLALARGYADRGEMRTALRQLERMQQALGRELGTTPSPAALELRARLEGRDPRTSTAGARVPPPVVPRQTRSQGVRLVGRRDVGDRVRSRLDRAASGRGCTLVLVGAPGVGKSALLDLTVAQAEQRGWRTGRGSASAVEGSWPYAPVLEALGDLCRKHPALLDGLDDLYRTEIDRALSGRELTWSGESGHQRLFVATAELLRLAAAGHGLVLAVDDVHDADEASMRLLHYLARCATREPVLIALAQRPGVRAEVGGILDSLVAKDTEARVVVRPLSEAATRRLLAERHPELSEEAVAHIWRVSAGIPFSLLELARQHTAGARGEDVVPVLPTEVQQTISRVALLGTTFTTDELLAVSGTTEEAAYRHLDVAMSLMIVEPAETGYRFRHPLMREALLRRMPHSVAMAARRDVAERLVELGAAPGRIAHQYVAAGLPRRAVPFVVRAVEVAGALGAYRDALSLIEAVRDHAGEEDLPRLLARRGDLLMALGDPEAVTAYRQALPLTAGTEHRLVRARLSRCASLSGDLDTARAALSGLALEGDAADGPVLLAQGNLAYFTGDVETAWAVAGRAREILDLADDAWHVIDLVSLQGLIAHQRGEWFDRFRMELRRTRGKDDLAVTVFDAHLCVAEYLLYGPMPYAEVVAEAEDLRARATRAGALRGIAFATALIGEAALLMGDIERAEHELEEAVQLHRDLAASAGEAHSLQRLAEVRLAQGRRDEATRLLHRALPLARWSQISLHLMQRIYGTLIAAAPDAAAARAVVDQAEASLGENDSCAFCDVMLAVPAAIACADVGDVTDARRHLAVAEASAARWSGTAWPAGVARARAHLALAEGRHEDVERLSAEAARLYEIAGQDADAARCRTEITAEAAHA